MYQLLEFIKSVYVLLLFIVLESCAILFYAHSNSYVNARILGATAWVSNGLNATVNRAVSYLSLSSENEALVGRIAQLEAELSLYQNQHLDSLLSTISISELGESRIAARVVTNTINRRHNHIIINRGVNHGVREGMALITPQREMVGEIISSFDNYAVAMSVLNTKFKSSGRLVNSNHAGSLSWLGKDRYLLRMSHLSKYAEPFEGAEVVTTNFSSIFPEGVKIGHVKSYRLNEDQTTYLLDIELSADISALDRVIVVHSDSDNEVRYINEMVDLYNRTN
ncbi:MAG: rod shape-determining protein MreC [Rikenellaceae bacterium]